MEESTATASEADIRSTIVLKVRFDAELTHHRVFITLGSACYPLPVESSSDLMWVDTDLWPQIRELSIHILASLLKSDQGALLRRVRAVSITSGSGQHLSRDNGGSSRTSLVS